VELHLGTIRLLAHRRGPAPSSPLQTGEVVLLRIRQEDFVPLRSDGKDSTAMGGRPAGENLS
jgi:hypothetical protein